MSAKEYRAGRRQKLERFMARPAMFATALFQERYETQARLSLVRSIRRLQEG